MIILAQTSIITKKGQDAPTGSFWCHPKHWRASQVFLVSEANCFCKKRTGFFINNCHKTAEAIYEYEKYDDGVFLQFFLSWITCGTCLLSGGGLPFALVPRLSGGVSCFEWHLFWRIREEDFSKLCWQATWPGQVRGIEEGGINHCV